MKKFSANYILLPDGSFLKNSIIKTTDEGEIIEIIDTKGVLKEEAGLEYYNGVIIPGFINVHCHLELSYLKNKIPEKKGLPGFIKNLQSQRHNFSENEIINNSIQWDKKMYANGIQAVGDICNSTHSIQAKVQSKILYISFIEILGTLTSKANEIYENGIKLKKQFEENSLPSMIVPHAPYSVSPALFEKIKHFNENEQSIISIHNQETKAENQLFENKRGELRQMLINWNLDVDYIPNLKKNSIHTYLPYLSKKTKLIFVHNTFTNKDDVAFAENYKQNNFWCLCPNANLHIENKLPDITMLRKYAKNICIGTDSLASNHKLCILSELNTIRSNFPDVNFQEMIKWATLNGAKALGTDNTMGSIEKGKKPGLILIQNFDFKNMHISEKSKIKRLI